MGLLEDRPELRRAALELVAAGQAHVFDAWPAPGSHDEDKARLLEQVVDMDRTLTEGGIVTYVQRGRALLQQSRKGLNPFDGFVPHVPEGERVAPGVTPDFAAVEEEGLAQVEFAAFVLVAGGLGERLGFHGIKISLPHELTTGMSYMEHYARSILALQAEGRARSGKQDLELPLAIMTSGDTHEPTVRLLEENGYFGLSRDQVTLMKQGKVPSIDNNEGHFVLDTDDPYQLSTKPHGHGDVHSLVHQHGLAKKWAAEGRKWVVFFQDTNGLVFRAVPAALAVSQRHSFDVNSLTVPRAPGEAVGAICHLSNASTGQQLTLNVEYNQLDPLLKSTVSEAGDVADESGFSPYPGNINVLVFNIPSYADVLESSGGLIPEFVNPKYADAEKTVFQKPTRLECMMQDYPKLLPNEAKVGFTECDRWMCFSAVKNNVKDAAIKGRRTGFPESACSGEADAYLLFRKILADSGKVDVEVDGSVEEFCGIHTKVGARVVLSPSFGLTQAEIASKFGSAKVSNASTLVLDGTGITVESLDLDGALVVKAVDGASVTIRNLSVKNAGWRFVPIDPDDISEPEYLRIRGYKLEKVEQRELIFAQPGEYVVDGADQASSL